MLDAEWSLTEVAEVALVEVCVHNPTAVDRRVRVENLLDGPTLPPRTGGVPEQGWDADGYAGVVPAGEELRLGYASPAAPTEPPVAVADEGRADGDGDAGETSPEAAVRLLGDASPPADALPAAGPDGGGGDVAAGDGNGNGNGSTGSDATADAGPTAAAADAGATASGGETRPETNGTATDEGTVPATDAGRSPPGDDGTSESGSGARAVGSDGSGRGGEGADCGGEWRGDAREAVAGSGSDERDGEIPPSVDAWLAGVERRVEHGERLTDASVVEAAAVLDERGGFGAVETLPDRLAVDEAALRAVAERATALAERAAATDVPLGALRRLS